MDEKDIAPLTHETTILKELSDIKANLVSLPYIHTPLRINLFNKYKTTPKVLKALTQMYPNVKKFQLG